MTVIDKLNKEKAILVATGTGVTSIKDGNTNVDYKKLHKEISIHSYCLIIFSN